MRLQQISVFLENAPGRVYEVTRALGEAGVHLAAVNLVDTGEFGVLRLIAPDVVAARRVLMEKLLPARVDEVVAAEVCDEPESLAAVLAPLVAEHINVDYMYAFPSFTPGRAGMIFHFSDNDRAVEILERSRTSTLELDRLRPPEVIAH
jgi:hypothetical protein